MAKLKDAAKTQNNGRWDQSFKDELFQVPSKSTPVRLWEEVKEIRQHWVEFVSQTKGKTGYGELCLNWDPVSEKSIPGQCPLCEAGQKATTYYYAFLINRRVQQKTGTCTVQPIRMTAKLAAKIGKLSEIVYNDLGDDAPDATDPKKGFNVLLGMTNTNGKVEYEAHASDKTPLTAEEREAFQEYVAEHDIGKMAKSAVQPRSALLEALSRRGVDGFASANAPDRKGNSAAKKRDYEAYDSPDDEDDPVSPPKKVSAEKRKSLTGDDDEDETPRKAARRTALDDDDEEEATPSRRYSTPDADDAPDEE